MQAGDLDDPRVPSESVRVLPGSDRSHEVTLIGVVHDHPASVYRVQRLIRDCRADVLALELPPLAIPLFEHYAEDATSPPARGGEMSAAIDAADQVDVVGIDGPSRGFLRRVCARMHRRGLSITDRLALIRSVAIASKTALRCRLGAGLSRWLGTSFELNRPYSHDCDALADPETQAAHERREVRKARAISNVLEPSPASACREDTRERYMSDRLHALRREGDVIAVVGLGHMDAIADRLSAAATTNDSRE